MKKYNEFLGRDDFPSLTIDELNAFVMFLKREMKRHYRDIQNIKEDIAYAHTVLRAKQTPTGYLRPYRTAMEMLDDKERWNDYKEGDNDA